jgi:hypothetical protein
MAEKAKRPRQNVKGRKTKGVPQPVVKGVTKAPKNL